MKDSDGRGISLMVFNAEENTQLGCVLLFRSVEMSMYANFL